MAVIFPGRPNELFDLTGGYTRVDSQGRVLEHRPLTPGEVARVQAFLNQPARDAQEASVTQQLIDGISSLQAARDAAQSDVTVAQQARTDAVTVKGQITARKDAVAGSTPDTSLAYVTAIRDELVSVYGFLEQIAQRLADDSAYRGQVDGNAVTTDNSLIWLAQRVGLNAATSEA